MLKESRELVGCDVSKAYLQHERHGRIHYDNDDQCNAPVMRNTHNLRGGRATGCTLNKPHTRFPSFHATSRLLLSNSIFSTFFLMLLLFTSKVSMLSTAITQNNNNLCKNIQKKRVLPPGSCQWQE